MPAKRPSLARARAQRLKQELVGLVIGKSGTERRRRALDALFRFVPRDVAFDLMNHASAPAPMDYERVEILLQQSSPRAATRRFSASKEPLTVRWIEEFGPGDVFYDIGANIGAYSLIAAAARDGAVHTFAFEPAIPSYYYLCLNVIFNDFADWITPLPFAAWSETTLIPFAHFSLEPGSVRHAFAFDAKYMSLELLFRQRQPAIALDDAVAIFDLPPPTHIKIDTEGGEAGILEGAAGLLAGTTLRSVLVELDPDQSFDPVEEQLRPGGFKLAEERARGLGARWRLYTREPVTVSGLGGAEPADRLVGSRK